MKGTLQDDFKWGIIIAACGIAFIWLITYVA